MSKQEFPRPEQPANGSNADCSVAALADAFLPSNDHQALNRPPSLPDYHLLGLAGSGAFGSVWVARDITGMLYAVKIVDVAKLGGQVPGEREEQALALVRQRVPQHPHLVRIFHVSRQGARLIYAMELADPAPGSTPAEQPGYQPDTLARRIAVSGRYTVADAVRLALDLLSALEALHAAGLVHRDVKPHNVVFVGGVPKLADIGLTALVQTMMSVAGTPGYLPLDGSTGPDADLYALGKLLYQTVTGLEPAHFPTVPAHLLTSPETQMLRRLNRVLLRACAPTKSERYRSANELRAGLESVLNPRQTWGVMWVWLGLGLLLLLGIVVWTVCFWSSPHPSQSARPSADALATQVGELSASPPPSSVDDEFLRSVAALPPPDQVRVVADKMRQLNPQFDGQLVPTFRDERVTGVFFSPWNVSDLSPLRAFPDLETLHCGSSVERYYGQIADLSPLRGLRLKKLRFAWNRVADLSPLEGMPLELLDCSGNAVRSLEPVRGMPLRELFCHTNQIRDLSPVQGLPLLGINCGANPIENWSPLADLTLTKLSVFDTSFHDFSMLRAAKLEFVWCQSSRVTDLDALARMPLVYLDCSGCRVTSLEPLRGRPLRFIGIRGTDVSDLSPLAGMQLYEVGLTGSKVRNLSPLTGQPIRVIELDFDARRDGPVLRTLPELRLINGQRKADLLR
ncbi:MAG: protein kinase [Gemmataceae bacterium]